MAAGTWTVAVVVPSFVAVALFAGLVAVSSGAFLVGSFVALVVFAGSVGLSCLTLRTMAVEAWIFVVALAGETGRIEAVVLVPVVIQHTEAAGRGTVAAVVAFESENIHLASAN